MSALVSLLSGCVFDPPPSIEQTSDAEVMRDARAGSDASDPGDASSLPDAEGLDAAAEPCTGTRPLAPFCDPNDPMLRACFTFDDFFVDAADVLIIRDGSAFGNLGTVTSGTVAPGIEGGALTLDGTGEMRLAPSPSLELERLTIEAWIRASLPPSGGRTGIVDKDSSFGFFLMPDGTLRCSAGGISAQGGQVAEGSWTHVACTFDGAAITLFQDGAAIVASTGGSTISTGLANPIAVGANSPSGDRLSGQIDALRIFGAARSTEQVCWDANR